MKGIIEENLFIKCKMTFYHLCRDRGGSFNQLLTSHVATFPSAGTSYNDKYDLVVYQMKGPNDNTVNDNWASNGKRPIFNIATMKLKAYEVLHMGLSTNMIKWFGIDILAS